MKPVARVARPPSNYEGMTVVWLPDSKLNAPEGTLLYAASTSDQLREVESQRDELLAALEALPEINISSQPEWNMSANNGEIWHLFLSRYSRAAIAKVKP